MKRFDAPKRTLKGYNRDKISHLLEIQSKEEDKIKHLLWDAII